MPTLWSDTIEAHRRGVRQAIMETTSRLVARDGLRAVTMSQIASHVGIGRGTLYKYFDSVESILDAHHEQHVADHLRRLVQITEEPGEAIERLRRVLDAYAMICHHRARHDTPELYSFLHRPAAVEGPESRVRAVVATLIAELARDVDRPLNASAANELALYCMHALAAGAHLPDEQAVHRLSGYALAGVAASVRPA